MLIRNTIFREAETGAAGGAQGAAAAAAGAPAAGSGAPAGDLAGFLGGVNPDVRSLIETKGWHKDATSPSQVLERMAQGYAGIEKTIGADKLALPPADKDGNRDWSKWDGYKALGRPDEPAGYTVFKAPEGVKYTDEQKAMHGEVGKLMHEAGLSDRQASHIAAGLAKMQEGREGKGAETVTAETEATAAALKGKWGQAYDSKIHDADKAMSAMPAELATKLVKAGLGRDAAFLEFLASVGAGMQEDGTLGQIGTGRGGGLGARTPAEAQAEINRLMSDPAHTAILGNKDHLEYRAANDRMARLFAEAYPEEKTS
jgi:hypothetical protein